MIVDILIPSPGESISEVEIASWLVEDGSYVEKDQEVAEIESEKATLMLVAPESGTITIKAAAQATVKIGVVAATVNTDAALANKPQAPQINQPQAQAAQVAPPVETKVAPPATKEPQQIVNTALEKVKVSPVAKKMMEEHHISIEDIINGLQRITSVEVEQVVSNASPLEQSIPAQQERQDNRVAMSQLRKKLAKRLVMVKNETAMLTTFNEVDMTAVMELRKRYQKEFTDKHGIKLGIMSFFTKAAVEALRLHPSVNSMIDGDEIVTPNYYDISIAVQTPKGLMVPVVRDAQALSLAGIEKKIQELADKGRSGKLALEEMTGGTFTITNGGVFGSMMSTPIINPPQSGILGMHNIIERPIAVNGKVEIRPMMYIALSYDHRIIDGKDSVGFLVALKQMIENPSLILSNNKDLNKILLDL